MFLEHFTPKSTAFIWLYDVVNLIRFSALLRFAIWIPVALARLFLYCYFNCILRPYGVMYDDDKNKQQTTVTYRQSEIIICTKVEDGLCLSTDTDGCALLRNDDPLTLPRSRFTDWVEIGINNVAHGRLCCGVSHSADILRNWTTYGCENSERKQFCTHTKHCVLLR